MGARGSYVWAVAVAVLALLMMPGALGAAPLPGVTNPAPILGDGE